MGSRLTSRSVVGGVVIATLTSLTGGGSAVTAAEADPPDGTPEPGAMRRIYSSGSDFIEWSGDSCDSIVLRVHMEGRNEEPIEKLATIGTSESDRCEQTLDAVKEVMPSAQDLTEAEVSAAAATSSNFIHTSHTLQDTVRIDIGFLRSSTKRFWTGSKTWWDESVAGNNLPAWAGSNPRTPWNHGVPDFWAVQFGCENPPYFPCADALYSSLGDFHTDFIHCNVVNQDIRLQTSVRSFTDGTYTVDFFKYGSCPGVFSATGKKANGTRTGGYGGGTDSITICPLPPPASNKNGDYNDVEYLSCQFAS
jgi:hypothetical protein